MSAYIPPTTVSALDAKVPHSQRKNRNVAHVGASAQAAVKTTKREKLPTRTGRRPYTSLRGLQNSGPTT